MYNRQAEDGVTEFRRTTLVMDSPFEKGDHVSTYCISVKYVSNIQINILFASGPYEGENIFQIRLSLCNCYNIVIKIQSSRSLCW